MVESTQQVQSVQIGPLAATKTVQQRRAAAFCPGDGETSSCCPAGAMVLSGCPTASVREIATTMDWIWEVVHVRRGRGCCVSIGDLRPCLLFSRTENKEIKDFI
jgi:hypothetical protein